MFGRGKKTSETATEPEVVKADGKGRPTRTRREAEAARKQPLIPADRKAAAAQQKAKSREARNLMNEAMITGDDRHLPIRDKGPIRRWVRDYVDSRTTPQEFVMFILLATLVAYFFMASQQQYQLLMILIMYVVVFAVIIFAVIFGFTLRRRLRAKFGRDAIPKGTVFYGVSRSFQLRRSRLPKPKVKRGEYPS